MHRALSKVSRWIILGLITALARPSYAETLVFSDFPERSWELAGEGPLTSAVGESVGNTKTYFLSSDDPSPPKNMVRVSSRKRSPNTGAREHLISYAHAIKMNCEAVQVSTPTLTIERGVPVSYARVYCGKHKILEGGMILSIKALQGKNALFAVIRQWNTPPFGFQVSIADREAFAKSIFDATEEASTWISQFEAANKHMTNEITLCANEVGEFGSTCATKKSGLMPSGAQTIHQEGRAKSRPS